MLMSFTAVIEYVVQWIIATVDFLVSVEGFRMVILLFRRNCPLGKQRTRSSVRTWRRWTHRCHSLSFCYLVVANLSFISELYSALIIVSTKLHYPVALVNRYWSHSLAKVRHFSTNDPRSIFVTYSCYFLLSRRSLTCYCEMIRILS